MNEHTIKKLIELNRNFYSQFSAPFADSRSNPQPGFNQLVEYFPKSMAQVLDVGCGNARFGRFLLSANVSFSYIGIDFTSELLTVAKDRVPGEYHQRDIHRPGYLDGMGKNDLIVCLATLQHIPGRTNRVGMLHEMKQYLTPQGRIMLSNWQFLESSRQRRKICKWEEIGLTDHDVDSGDYLLTWQRNGRGLRYVCSIDIDETKSLAKDSDLRIVAQFRNDGKEGNLNLYTVLEQNGSHYSHE